jgi:8-oxo-dGTP pyrophosphatase MutT (NUDIX family)
VGTDTKLPAATIILVRERPGGGVETLLLRRHRKSSFMSDTFVFPGGKLDADDADLATAAIRELFEEAGVLLVRGALDPERRAAWRARLNAGEASFTRLLREERLEPDFARLHAWARWVTPSIEPKRFDAHFYLAEMPADQATSYDQKETVEEAWVAPAEAIARHLDAASGFRLPPPQLRTLHELNEAGASLGALVAAARARAPHVAPVMPRFADLGGGKMALLLPWDPDYGSRGTGEGVEWPAAHPLGVGPSRFMLEGMSWRLDYAGR